MKTIYLSYNRHLEAYELEDINEGTRIVAPTPFSITEDETNLAATVEHIKSEYGNRKVKLVIDEIITGYYYDIILSFLKKRLPQAEISKSR